VLGQYGAQLLKYSITVLQDLAVFKPHHPIALGAQPLVAFNIACVAQYMRFPVGLHHNAGGMAAKVNDVAWREHDLPTEMPGVQRRRAQY